MVGSSNTYWQQIKQFFRDEFQLEPEIHNILFMIGVQELGYGFQPLDKDTKTKVINFASIFLLNFIKEEDRKNVKQRVSEGSLSEEDSEDEIYKTAITNYFKKKKII